MSAPGALHFSMGDLYPDLAGNYGTRTLTIPSSVDQTALVDDEEAAKENSVQTSPQQHRNIFITLAAVVVGMFIFSKFA